MEKQEITTLDYLQASTYLTQAEAAAILTRGSWSASRGTRTAVSMRWENLSAGGSGTQPPGVEVLLQLSTWSVKLSGRPERRSHNSTCNMTHWLVWGGGEILKCDLFFLFFLIYSVGDDTRGKTRCKKKVGDVE